MLSQAEVIRIASIVRTALTGFANGFSTRHVGESQNPTGVINLKKMNVFMNALPNELIYYSALVRSFDSSFGKLLESIALEIARGNFEVSQKVIGKIDGRQRDHINDMMSSYKGGNKPDVAHYNTYNTPSFALQDASHASDHVFFDAENNTYHIIELKAGGDLDNKKAEVEKRALLEQYFILKNSTAADVKLHFATAYNKFGEGNEWKQDKLNRFFAQDELLIGKDFWNFVCRDKHGFEVVAKSYSDNIHQITATLEDITRDIFGHQSVSATHYCFH